MVAGSNLLDEPFIGVFMFQTVPHDWYNKGCVVYSPVYVVVYIYDILSVEHCSTWSGSSFQSHYLCGPLPYVLRQYNRD